MTVNGLPRYSRHIEDAALVVGWPALLLSRLLEDYLSGAPDYDRVRLLRQVADDLRRAGEGSAVGTREQAGAELVPSSRHDQHDDIGADEAAAMLGCSAGYARRLAREQRLAAWRGPGGAWRFDLADVEAEAHYRREGAA